MSRRPAPGFTLMEVLVVVAIGVLLAAAVVPALVGRLDRARIDESAESLDAIARAVNMMWRDTGRFPGRLAHLTTPITAGQTDLCNAAFGAAAAANWAGPYLNRSVAAAGLPLPIGLARDVLGLTPPPPGTVLRIEIEDVSHEDAVRLDTRVDGGDGNASGSVRWGAVSGGGTVLLSWAVPIRAC